MALLPKSIGLPSSFFPGRQRHQEGLEPELLRLPRGVQRVPSASHQLMSPTPVDPVAQTFPCLGDVLVVDAEGGAFAHLLVQPAEQGQDGVREGELPGAALGLGSVRRGRPRRRPSLTRTWSYMVRTSMNSRTRMDLPLIAEHPNRPSTFSDRTAPAPTRPRAAARRIMSSKPEMWSSAKEHLDVGGESQRTVERSRVPVLRRAGGHRPGTSSVLA